MELTEGERLLWEGKPSWRSTMSFYLQFVAAGLIPLVVILIARAVSDVDWSVWVGILIALAALVLGVLIGWVRRHFTHYTITNRRITIRTGVLAKTERTAHIDRLQNVTIRQSPLDRVFQVGTLDFDTAGGDSDSNLNFLGIDDPQDLRDTIAREYLSEKHGVARDATAQGL